MTEDLTAAACRRFPCDTAFGRRRHVVRDGVVQHVVSAHSDSDQGWSTGTIAFESVDGATAVDDGWQTFLQVTNDDGARVMYLLGEAEMVERLAFGLLIAARRGLQAQAGMRVNS